ncbi:MAG: ABC transporter substrate-binding protein [Oscillospiraceae bacterium]
MSKNLKRVLCVTLALVMVLALAACGTKPATTTGTPAPEKGADTIVVGYSYFSQRFSPFFAKTSYDQDVATMVNEALIGNDRGGNMILNGIEGETIAYNGTDYTYNGIADIAVVQNDDGTVDYNITLKDGVLFSDGSPMTIDDVIFNMYVYSDPTYDGSGTFYSLPITGMQDYRDSMAILYQLILAAGPENTDFTNWTEEQQTQYFTAFNAAGEKFAQEIVDYMAANAGTTTVAEAAAQWAYGGLAADATAADFFAAIVANYGYDISDGAINAETAGSNIADLINTELGDAAATFNGTVTVGEAVPSIAGIKKTGDNTLTVTTDKFEATSIYQFAIYIAPMSYYGDPALYDYDNNMFGFNKGDLSTVRAKTTAPMGAGPYKFVSYENGIVTFEANENFWKGAPKTKTLLFQETSDADKLAGIVSGTFDITDPSFSTDVVESVKGYNSNGELTGDVITTDTSDFLGYGYIGFCAENVKVGDDPASIESKNLRKALATLFAVYRDTVVNSYYGEVASVIQYPISNTSWAAPMPSDEGYKAAYSTDIDGKAIYTDTMTEEERGAAALQAAVGFLKAAGYTYDEATAMFTAAPDGASMTYEVIIPGDGEGNHPSYGVLTSAKEALASIGLTLEINDPTDSNVLWNAIQAIPSTGEIWCAAWQATPDPDMYQVYHSSNINGAGGTDSNSYYVNDPKLDELILEARTSPDQSFRKATYKQCLELIMDWAVELPVYQRQNALTLSTERVNVATLTPDITPFWKWYSDISLLEMN